MVFLGELRLDIFLAFKKNNFQLANYKIINCHNFTFFNFLKSLERSNQQFRRTSQELTSYFHVLSPPNGINLPFWVVEFLEFLLLKSICLHCWFDLYLLNFVIFAIWFPFCFANKPAKDSQNPSRKSNKKKSQNKKSAEIFLPKKK